VSRDNAIIGGKRKEIRVDQRKDFSKEAGVRFGQRQGKNHD